MQDVGLVADVGRRKVRFGLSGGMEGIEPRAVREFDIADCPTFTGAMTSYLDQVGSGGRSMATALSIAGIVRGDVVNITGSRWYISLAGIRAVMQAPTCAVNDFAANAAALPMLSASAIMPVLGPPAGLPVPGGAYVAVGLGTGLGVAGLVTVNDRLHAVASEAGHIAFDPSTDGERRLVEYLARKGIHYVTAETVLSASGLLAAYAAFGGSPAVDRAEEVTRRQAGDAAAREAVALLTGHLAAFAGDMAMVFGAWDGIFLIGAIARALKPVLDRPDFRRRLEAKGNYERQLRQVPVAVVTRTQLELLGAAVILNHATAGGNPGSLDR